MARDIDLYLNCAFCGCWPLDKIEEYFSEYREKAAELADDIDWDEIILYAIYSYDGEKGTFLSADFMLLRMDNLRYTQLCDRISPDCRLFVMRNT